MIHFEVCLSNLGSSQVDDLVRQAVVVLMGSLAKHMDKEDQKVATHSYDYVLYQILFYCVCRLRV